MTLNCFKAWAKSVCVHSILLPSDTWNSVQWALIRNNLRWIDGRGMEQVFQFPPDQFCSDCVWVERSVSNWVTEMSGRLLGSAHVFTRKDKLVKFRHLGSVVFCSFPSCWEFSSPTFFTRGLASGTLKPHDTHTQMQVYIYIFLPPSPFHVCQSLCFFPSFSISVFLSFSLSVQCSVSESLKSIPDHFLWHTAKACSSAAALTGWGQASQKVVWEYVSICEFELHSMHTFAWTWCHLSWSTLNKVCYVHISYPNSLTNCYTIREIIITKLFMYWIATK